MSEVFKGQLTHRSSGQDVNVHLTVISRLIVDGNCRIVWTADGTKSPIPLRTTIAPAQYHDTPMPELARWLLVGELGQ